MSILYLPDRYNFCTDRPFPNLWIKYNKTILNIVGGTMTIIGPEGKPVEVNANSIALGGLSSNVSGLLNSDTGATGTLIFCLDLI